MAFFDDVSKSIGNFFGGIFGGNQKKKKKDDQQQQNRSRPTYQNTQQNQQSGFNQDQNQSLQPKKPVNIFEDLNKSLTLKGAGQPRVVPVFKPQTAPTPTPEPKPIVKPDPLNLNVRTVPNQKPNPALDLRANKPVPKANQGNAKWPAKFAAGMQQMGGSLLDAVVQGGEVAAGLVDPIVRDPFISKERRNQLNMESQRRLEKTRATINSWKDLTGEKIDNRRTDEAADRLSRGKGSVQDLTLVGGRAINDASTATMPINPLRTLGGKALVDPTFRQVAPFILKEGGVFGTANAIAQGGETYGATGNIDEALKQAAIGFAGGFLPQVGLESAAYGTRRAFKGATGAPPRFGRSAESGEAIISGEATPNKVSIPVKKDIPVDEVVGDNLDIPVSVNTPKKPEGPIIRELSGDAPSVGQSATNAVEVPTTREVPIARPDQRIEGVSTNPTDVFTVAKKAEVQSVIDDQLRTGKIDGDSHKVLTDELAKTPAVDEVVPQGQKIEVKAVNSIPVTDQTIVPTGLPETPGTVRATTSTAPNNTKSAAVAAQMPPPISKVGTIMPDGTKVTKRMVKTERENRKNANKLAKAQEGTADAYSRVEAARGQRSIVEDNPAPGYAKTGKLKKGERGNMYEVKNRETGMENATKATQNTSIKEFIDTNHQKDLWGDDTMLEAEAILNRSHKMGNANPDELRVLAKKVDEQASRKGQDLALLEKTSRKADTSDKMTNRFVNKFYAKSENGSLTHEQITKVTKANDEFTSARDDAARKFELANDNPTKANVKAYEDAVSSQKKLDKAARFEELMAAKKALKGDKSPSAAKFLKQLEDAADVPNFDYVNANLLSGTGTISRNSINQALIASERLNITGSNLRGVPKGIKEGAGTWWSEMKMRIKAGGKNPINWVKNWTTTGNTSGDMFLRGAAKGDATKYYRNQLKKAGYRGEELGNRTKLLAAQDSENIAETAFREQLQQAGLASLTHGGKAMGKLENTLTDNISGYFGNIPVVKTLSKGLVNTLFGYPTITVRNAMRGIDRATLGIPNLLKAGGLKAIGEPGLAKVSVRQSTRNLKSGAVIGGLGAALYNADLISFGYPDDEDARKHWKDERKSEYSIKIGDSWYPITTMMGPFAIPLMAPGITLETLKNGGNLGDVAKNLSKMVVDSATPVDDFVDVGKALQGEETGNWWAQKAALLAGSQIPASGLLRQVAKMFDDTVRTADKDAEFFVQTYQNIIKALPGLSKDAPASNDNEGNPYKHPNPLEILAGAATKENKTGVERSQETNQGTNSTLDKIDKYGLLSDSNMDGVLEGTGLEAYNKSKSGRQLDESDIKALKEGLVKGVKAGTDTAYLERGEYDTNLAVLNLKRDNMQADKTTKPSALKDIDTDIKRGTVYRDNQLPYDLISMYKSGGDNAVGVEEWRKMGDPEDDEYDPDMYQKLWDIDQMMTKAGVSYKKGALDKPKYFVKEKKGGKGSGGKGGSGSKQIDTDFGKLKAGTGAPNVKQYDTIEAKSGSVPHIAVKRPNIVHSIGRG